MKYAVPRNATNLAMLNTAPFSHLFYDKIRTFIQAREGAGDTKYSVKGVSEYLAKFVETYEEILEES